MLVSDVFVRTFVIDGTNDSALRIGPLGHRDSSLAAHPRAASIGADHHPRGYPPTILQADGDARCCSLHGFRGRRRKMTDMARPRHACGDGSTNIAILDHKAKGCSGQIPVVVMQEQKRFTIRNPDIKYRGRPWRQMTPQSQNFERLLRCQSDGGSAPVEFRIKDRS